MNDKSTSLKSQFAIAVTIWTGLYLFACAHHKIFGNNTDPAETPVLQNKADGAEQAQAKSPMPSPSS